MNTRPIATALAAAALTAAFMHSPQQTNAADCGVVAGPDIIVGDIAAIRNWGADSGTSAYSYGPTLCNIGTAQAVFQANSTQHPVTAHNLYRWTPHTPGAAHGSLEQIGMSWASHHVFALSSNHCCTDCEPTDGTTLGVKCSSAEGAAIMGSASLLGPRSEVNPVTGAFIAFHATPTGPVTLAGRVQVANTDLDQSDPINADSKYYAENHTISPDDAANGAGNNNVSQRSALVNTIGPNHSLALVGATVEAPAIFAWGDNEPGVLFSIVDIPGDGRFIIASNASNDDGDGTWRYDYAVYNMNSAEATAQFTVPASISAAVSSIASRNIAHHSGEIYDTANWSGAHADQAVRWNAQPITPASNANAIHWGTLHSFSFNADAPPATRSVRLTLHNSGAFSPLFDIKSPVVACPSDINGDGVTDTADLGLLIADFGSSEPTLADINGDGAIDTADLGQLIADFGSPCV